MNLRKYIFAVALITSGSLNGAQLTAAENAATDPETKAAPAAGDAQLAIAGRALYARHCLHCHGVNMLAAGSVADLRQFPHDDKGRFIQFVKAGKNSGMPAWSDVLKDGEIDALWAYVKTGGK
jgi:quinohemoprotein ethanol dehydrogenase